MLSNGNFLYGSQSDMNGLVGLGLTLYCKLVYLGGPIFIEEFSKVDRLASPGLLRPWQMSTAYFNLDTQLGCRRNISTHI